MPPHQNDHDKPVLNKWLSHLFYQAAKAPRIDNCSQKRILAFIDSQNASQPVISDKKSNMLIYQQDTPAAPLDLPHGQPAPLHFQTPENPCGIQKNHIYPATLARLPGLHFILINKTVYH